MHALQEFRIVVYIVQAEDAEVSKRVVENKKLVSGGGSVRWPWLLRGILAARVGLCVCIARRAWGWYNVVGSVCAR